MKLANSILRGPPMTALAAERVNRKLTTPFSHGLDSHPPLVAFLENRLRATLINRLPARQAVGAELCCGMGKSNRE